MAKLAKKSKQAFYPRPLKGRTRENRLDCVREWLAETMDDLINPKEPSKDDDEVESDTPDWLPAHPAGAY